MSSPSPVAPPSHTPIHFGAKWRGGGPFWVHRRNPLEGFYGVALSTLFSSKRSGISNPLSIFHPLKGRWTKREGTGPAVAERGGGLPLPLRVRRFKGSFLLSIHWYFFEKERKRGDPPFKFLLDTKPLHTILSIDRPRIGRRHPPDLSISLSGGKETNQDSLSSGERSGKSPSS